MSDSFEFEFISRRDETGLYRVPDHGEWADVITGLRRELHDLRERCGKIAEDNFDEKCQDLLKRHHRSTVAMKDEVEAHKTLDDMADFIRSLGQ